MARRRRSSDPGDLYAVWSRRSRLWLDPSRALDLRYSGLAGLVGRKGSLRARCGADAVSLERLPTAFAVPACWRADAAVRTGQCRPALSSAGHDLRYLPCTLSA